MLDWLDVTSLTAVLQANPGWALVGAFLTSFTESLAIIGAIMPGAVLMSVIGFLIATSVLKGGITYASLAAGAMLGNLVSYWVGWRFHHYLRKLSFFQKRSQLLVSSERFFSRHGGKSIFIGQFIGPMRAVLPLTAGILKMSPVVFTLVAIPSAMLWSVVYTLPGLLLGVLSLELPPEMMARFAGVSLVALVVLWSLIWLMQFCCRGVWRWWNIKLQRTWANMRDGGGKRWRWLTSFLSEADNPDNHRQLSRLLWVGVGILLLVALLLLMSNQRYSIFEQGLHHFFQTCRMLNLDRVMIVITNLGDEKLLSIFWLVVLFWLFQKGYFYLAWHWMFLFSLMIGATALIKSLFFLTRPGGGVYGLTGSSFPSGHMVVSTAVFGLISAILAREWSVGRRYLYMTSAGLIMLIAFTRIYLGVHWLSDVMGGILIGGLIVLLITISYFRRKLTIDAQATLRFCIGSLLMLWIGYSVVTFQPFCKMYRKIWPVTVARFDELVRRDNHDYDIVPLYRPNRFGSPVEPFNLVMVGNLEYFSKLLNDCGWQLHQPLQAWRSTLNTIFGSSLYHYRRLFPQLYQGNHLALLASRKTDKTDTVVILQLWRANISLVDDDHTVWIGNVGYHQQQAPLITKEGFRSLFSGNCYLSALKQLEDAVITVGDYQLFYRDSSKDLSGGERWMDWSGQCLVLRQNDI